MNTAEEIFDAMWSELLEAKNEPVSPTFLYDSNCKKRRISEDEFDDLFPDPLDYIQRENGLCSDTELQEISQSYASMIS